MIPSPGVMKALTKDTKTPIMIQDSQYFVEETWLISK